MVVATTRYCLAFSMSRHLLGELSEGRVEREYNIPKVERFELGDHKYSSGLPAIYTKNVFVSLIVCCCLLCCMYNISRAMGGSGHNWTVGDFYNLFFQKKNVV